MQVSTQLEDQLSYGLIDWPAENFSTIWTVISSPIRIRIRYIIRLCLRRKVVHVITQTYHRVKARVHEGESQQI